jgi:hypothetical protein
MRETDHSPEPQWWRADLEPTAERLREKNGFCTGMRHKEISVRAGGLKSVTSFMREDRDDGSQNSMRSQPNPKEGLS